MCKLASESSVPLLFDRLVSVIVAATKALAALPDESEKVMPDDEVWPDNVPSPLDEDEEYLLLSMDMNNTATSSYG